MNNRNCTYREKNDKLNLSLTRIHEEEEENRLLKICENEI